MDWILDTNLESTDAIFNCLALFKNLVLNTIRSISIWFESINKRINKCCIMATIHSRSTSK